MDRHYAKRGTIDRVLDNFLSISNNDHNHVLWDGHKTCSIELLGERTSKAGPLGQPIISYYAPIKIGEPSKTYRIQFELTTNDIFVPHYELLQEVRRKLGMKTIMRNDQSYRGRSSETGRKVDKKRRRSISFQGSRFEGKMYEDFLQLSVIMSSNSFIGDDDDRRVEIRVNQHFVAIKKAPKQIAKLSLLPIHGFLGLGPRLRSPTGVKSFLLNLRDEHHIDKMRFSIWFNKWTPSAKLVFGGVDRSKYVDPIQWHMSDPNEWTVDIERVELGRTLIIAYGGMVPRGAIDMSVSDIFGPKEAVRRIHHELGVSVTNHLPLIDSSIISLMPPLVINMDGYSYRIEARNYVKWCEDGPYVAILPSPNNRWILSSIFLESRYTIFDAERHKIGFARINPSLN